MTDYAKGTRVGAIKSADDTTVELLGFGTYQGYDESPLGVPNPKIELDDGTVVWGFQCWWGEQEKIEKMCVGRVVNNVRL